MWGCVARHWVSFIHLDFRSACKIKMLPAFWIPIQAGKKKKYYSNQGKGKGALAILPQRQ
jgi:hypothetical protein